MKYDFTSILDRRGKDAIAVDAPYVEGCFNHEYFAAATLKEGMDWIPMWVADMNFPTVPTVQKAVVERTAHPAFGYFSPRDEYFGEIIKWQETRNQVTGLTKECIGYENGVLGGVISALNVLCSKGDSVLVHSPTYVGFTGALTNNGYYIVHSALKKTRKMYGAWTLPTWKRRLWKITFTPALCAVPIIQQVASGSVGNWKKLWSFSRNMMCMWFPMRSGPI